MPSPTFNLQAPNFLDIHPASGEILRSALSGLRTFYKTVNTATTNPTNIYAVLDGTTAQAASCIVTPVPPGANTLVLFHDYSAGGSGTLTTVPVIRVFGEVPEESTGTNGAAYHPSAQSAGPARAAEVAGNIKSRDWIPLLELGTGSLTLTMGTTTPAMIFTTGTYYRSSPVFANLLGTSRVAITVSTAGGYTSHSSSGITGAFLF